MKAQNPLKTAPTSSIDTAPFAHFSSLYRQRQLALTLIKQLVQLTKGVQQHRGMSMAMLGGNQHFRADFLQLQRSLERRILALQAFTTDSRMLSEKEQQNLHNAWVTISRDWQQDSVIDNYELHCHLVEQLLITLASLSRQLEEPLSEQSNPTQASGTKAGLGRPSRLQNLELLHFCTRLMPAVVEQIGRIRALASYAAALGHCDSHHDGKLRYVIQNTQVNNEKLRHQIRRLESLLGPEFNQMGELKRYELKLMFLLNMVETDVLTGELITADSNRVFKVATDIIDVYLQVVEKGILLLSQWLDRDLEAWLEGDGLEASS